MEQLLVIKKHSLDQRKCFKNIWAALCPTYRNRSVFHMNQQSFIMCYYCPFVLMLKKQILFVRNWVLSICHTFRQSLYFHLHDYLCHYHCHLHGYIDLPTRSALTAACEIHANIEPLGKHREKAALRANRKLVDRWQSSNNLQQKSVLHKVWEMKKKYHLPEERKVTQAILKKTPPHIDLRLPVIKLAIQGSLSKKDDPT